MHGPLANGGYETNNNPSHGPFGVISGGNRVNSYGNLNSLAAASTTVNHQKSSPRQQQQQQILLPKELFPSVSMNATYQPNQMASNSRSGHHNQQHQSHKSSRPVKLPLRKHHSFHFQPSQTVAGSKQERSYLKNYYKSNGPLVFKPIKPVPATANSNNTNTNTCQQNSSSTSSTPSPTPPHTISSLSSPPSSSSATAQNLSHTSPRICGTRLKRHHSNVEATATTGFNANFDVVDGSRGIHTISNGNTALGVYGTMGRSGVVGGVGVDWDAYGTTLTAGGQIGKRLHYVELDQNFGQVHSRARREERRRRPERGLSFLSDDEGMKQRRSKSVVGSDCEVEGYLTADGEANGLVFGAFEEDRLNLRHFKDKYFLQPTGTSTTTATTGSRNAANGNSGSGRTPKRSDTQEHPQQLKSQSSSTTTTNATGNPKRTQYATLNFNEVNI